MSYIWIPIQDENNLNSIFQNIDKKYTLRSTNDWYRVEGMKIYGYYTTERNAADMIFEYSQTQQRENLPDLKNSNNIFSKLIQYGSSSQFHGLKDAWGKDIIMNIYHQIDLLVSTECQTLFIVRRYSVYGVVNSNGEIIVPIKYLKIFDAGEFTLGFKENDMIGFMNYKGEIIIPAKYKDIEGYNYFYEGKSLAYIANNDNAIDHYINHYGDCVGYPEYENDNYGCCIGSTAYIGEDDILDAYEGDSSNLWNTD